MYIEPMPQHFITLGLLALGGVRPLLMACRGILMWGSVGYREWDYGAAKEGRRLEKWASTTPHRAAYLCKRGSRLRQLDFVC